MAKRAKTGVKIDTTEGWNSVILSFATTGGYIIANGKMAEIHICSPKMNVDTLILENKFLTYWIESKKLPELYQDIYMQEDELSLHLEDADEQRKIAEERDEALLLYNKLKKFKKSNKILIDESEPIEDPDNPECART